MVHILNIPPIELDALHWQPNWTPQPVEAFRYLTRTAVTAERWVLDASLAVSDVGSHS